MGEDENQDSYGSSTDLDDRGNSIDDQPLFDNVRDIVADPPATGTPGPTIDLAGGGFVGLSNGVLAGSSDGQSTASEINLTGTTTPTSIIENLTTEAPETRDYQDSYGSPTTIQPVYEDVEDSEYDDGSRSAGQEYDDVVEDAAEEYDDGDYDVKNNIEYDEDEVIDVVTTSRPSLISIPLVIEEEDGDVQVPGGGTTVILAGTDEERKPDTLYGGPIDGYEDENTLRTSRQTNANSPAHSQGVRIRPPKSFQYVESPQTKRQVKAQDLSQRIRERQRQRIWRQFNLDRRQGRAQPTHR